MKSSIKRNLTIGFSLSLLLLLLSSAASYISITSLLSSSRWVNHTNEVIHGLEEMVSVIKDAETSQRGYLITREKSFLQAFAGAQAQSRQRLLEVKKLTADNPAQQATLQQLEQLLLRHMDILQQAVGQQTVDVALLSQDKASMDSLLEQIGLMKNREQVLLESRTALFQRFSLYTPGLVLSAAIVAVLIALFFYLRLRKDVEQRARLQKALQQKEEEMNRRIALIEQVANQVAKGNYTVRITDGIKDDLGGLAFSLNQMAVSLENSFTRLSDNEWQQRGLAQLNELLIGTGSLDELLTQAISFLAFYTGSHAGALYLQQQKTLHFGSGYAFSPAEAQQQIPIGQGLLGQAVAGRQILLLKEIPEDALQINYATGNIRATSVVVLPVFDGHVVKGAVELVSLQVYTGNHQRFLEAVSHLLGPVISRAQNERRLQELLEETQSQSEELQAQHSELENLNTELEMQAQKLQASDEELRVQQEELLQANQELEERSHLLEEQNKLILQRNREIQQQAEALALSTRYKSEFLANMSHELRTPLNSILLLSRLMSENKSHNLSEEQVEYARVIQGSGKGLLSLIDEILDLSKIESGKMELEYGQMPVDGLLQNLNALFGHLAAEKALAFHLSVAPGVPAEIETDQLRLEQVLRNLLSNAFKFTSQGAVVLEVSLAPENQQLVNFAVKDTGIGIPREKQHLVFEAFQQADGSTRRKYGGTGLGLSISRELAKLLGGEIRLESEPGQGCIFTLQVPVSRKAQEESPVLAPPVPALPDIPAESLAKELYTAAVIPAAIPDDRDNLAAGDQVILIVEDDTGFAQSLLQFTRDRGYKGIVAVRGDEGLQLARQYKPLGILLDIQLPVKNGWEVMEDLKNDPQTRPIPVHIMSSHEVKTESLLKGAVDFINKPFAFDQLQEVFGKIEQVLSRHPKKVLIVEENAKHAKALAYFLGSFDMGLEVKHSINDGIEALQRKEVDCVILDMGIPARHSYETLDLVKQTRGLEHIPIIVFTGKSLSPTEEMRIKKYADSIIVKTAHSYQRIQDEVSLFLHLVEENSQPPAAARKPYKKLGAITEVLQHKKILIADDDIRNIFSLTKILESYQVNVLSAIDGREAFRMLEENPGVDIVLMDMMMPEMDGYETTRRIRKEPRWKELPIIAVTAKAMTGDREKCMDAGASDYITKPVDMDQLLSLLRVWLYERG